MRASDEIAFAEIVRNESKRTVLCPPSIVDRVRRRIEYLGLGDIVSVRESPFVQDGTLWLVDDAAIEAATREALQHGMKRGLWG